MGYEVDAEVDGVANVGDVARSERREVDRHTGDVDTFASSEAPGIECSSVDVVAVDGVDDEIEFAIVDEDVYAGADIAGNVGVGEGDAIVGRETVGVADEAYFVAGGYDYGCVVVGEIVVGGADFGAFGVDEDADAFGNLTDIIDDFGETFEGEVRRVHTHDVHTVNEKVVNEVDITTAVGNGSYNLSKFFHIRTYWKGRRGEFQELAARSDAQIYVKFKKKWG